MTKEMLKCALDFYLILMFYKVVSFRFQILEPLGPKVYVLKPIKRCSIFTGQNLHCPVALRIEMQTLFLPVLVEQFYKVL